MSTRPRRGRRPGAPDTKAAILAAARTRFAEHGFSHTSVRSIAADAGVDPALVHHYFGTKDDLLVQALALPVDPRELLAPVVAEGADGAAERLLRVFLSVWDDPELQLGLVAVVRRSTEPGGERLLREGFLPVVLMPIAEGLGIDDPQRRMALAASQVIGLILMRYVLRVEPIVALSPDEVVAIYAPTLQRYLTGPLP